MKVGVIISAVCLLFLIVVTDPLGLWSCTLHRAPAVERESVQKAKSVYNLLTVYAGKHQGLFPNAYDMQFLNECVSSGRIPKDAINDYRVDGAEDGTTGYSLFRNMKQTMRGSNILFITTKPVYEDKFTVVTISGKTECVPEDEALDKLIATMDNRSWKPRSLDGEK